MSIKVGRYWKLEASAQPQEYYWTVDAPAPVFIASSREPEYTLRLLVSEPVARALAKRHRYLSAELVPGAGRDFTSMRLDLDPALAGRIWAGEDPLAVLLPPLPVRILTREELLA